MNRSDLPRIAKQGQEVAKLLDKHGTSLFDATKDWQTPLRSGGAAGCKGDHGDPTGVTAQANLEGHGDPLAAAHDEFLALLKAKDKADTALGAFVYHHKPVDPNTVSRGRVNLVPSCVVCGGPAIPIRRGMCPRDHQAWLRADKPDLEGFKRMRQRETEAEKAKVHEHEVA